MGSETSGGINVNMLGFLFLTFGRSRYGLYSVL